MNYQHVPLQEPLTVLLINCVPPATTAQLLSVKILRGTVFGKDILINLIIYFMAIHSIDQRSEAECLKVKLENCGLPCCNSIEAVNKLPSLVNVNFCCIITNLINPNKVIYHECTCDSKEYWDNFDLVASQLIKLSKKLHRQLDLCCESNYSFLKSFFTERFNVLKSQSSLKKLHINPADINTVFLTDGLVPLDILSQRCEGISWRIFSLCPMTNMAASLLRQQVKDYSVINFKEEYDPSNEILVWGATDQLFHVEILPTLMDVTLSQQRTRDPKKCIVDAVSRPDRWVHKKYVAKIKSIAKTYYYGEFSRSSQYARILSIIWSVLSGEKEKAFANLGVISNGDIGTIKGLAYALPTWINQHSFTIDKRFSEQHHLRLEIKKINAEAQHQHKFLMEYSDLQPIGVDESFLLCSAPPPPSSRTLHKNGLLE